MLKRSMSLATRHRKCFDLFRPDFEAFCYSLLLKFENHVGPCWRVLIEYKRVSFLLSALFSGYGPSLFPALVFWHFFIVFNNFLTTHQQKLVYGKARFKDMSGGFFGMW